MPAWSTKTRRSPSRHRRNARVFCPEDYGYVWSNYPLPSRGSPPHRLSNEMNNPPPRSSPGVCIPRGNGMTSQWHGMAWHGMAWHGMACHGQLLAIETDVKQAVRLLEERISSRESAEAALVRWRRQLPPKVSAKLQAASKNSLAPKYHLYRRPHVRFYLRIGGIRGICILHSICFYCSPIRVSLSYVLSVSSTVFITYGCNTMYLVYRHATTCYSFSRKTYRSIVMAGSCSLSDGDTIER